MLAAELASVQSKHACVPPSSCGQIHVSQRARHTTSIFPRPPALRDKDGPHLNACRALFGDDSQDYGQALEKHYKEGAPADWQQRFVSSYASAHPWEDWAETWAHYLHMRDTLEIAVDSGVTLKPKRAGEPVLKPDAKIIAPQPSAFEAMIDSWHALTYVMNNLNRGMGLPDGYPFVLSPPVVEKLRFVHEVVSAQATRAKWPA
jgi:hypothetical protein